ncbi:gamma-glutamyltransferase, partial [Bacillus sp. WP8]|uniref:gamma-glutamyltransferase n=1 Tax=Bacillus sp. WP8 TaxID=756828 RepID=UPI0021B52023
MLLPQYPFFLNNQLTHFHPTPPPPNQLHPNKPPLSTITPTIIFKHNHPLITLPSPPPTTIIPSLSQTILN